jgi:hypothetical protein
VRRLFRNFILALREKPFSYKIAYCRELSETPHFDPRRLRELYDSTEYLVGRAVLVDAIRRHELPVPMTFLRHIATTGNRYFLKGLLLILGERKSLRTLVRIARHPLCQDDPLMRFLLIQAARAQDINPNNLEIYVNTEQAEFSEDEARTWRLWRPLDELLSRVNDSPDVDPDTLRLMLWDNRPALAEDLGRDLSDIFNIAPEALHGLPLKSLTSLLAKYVDLSYLLCQALWEGDFQPLEARLAEECRIQPPGILLPPEATDKPPARRGGPPATQSRGAPEFEELYPEEQMLDRGEGSDEPLEDLGSGEEGAPVEPDEEAELTLDDIAFDPAWTRVIPHMLAEELLIIPLHVEGDPPRRITVGCARGDSESVARHLERRLGCRVECVDLPEALIREAILRFY